MAVYSTVVTVSVTAYTAEPSIVFPFDPKRVTVCNMDAADMGYVSFSGNLDSGALLNDVKSPSSKQEWVWQYGRKLWLRTGGNAVKLQVIAEA